MQKLEEHEKRLDELMLEKRKVKSKYRHGGSGEGVCP